jgi:hypothetical protein
MELSELENKALENSFEGNHLLLASKDRRIQQILLATIKD